MNLQYFHWCLCINLCGENHYFRDSCHPESSIKPSEDCGMVWYQTADSDLNVSLPLRETLKSNVYWTAIDCTIDTLLDTLATEWRKRTIVKFYIVINSNHEIFSAFLDKTNIPKGTEERDGTFLINTSRMIHYKVYWMSHKSIVKLCVYFGSVGQKIQK